MCGHGYVVMINDFLPPVHIVPSTSRRTKISACHVVLGILSRRPELIVPALIPPCCLHREHFSPSPLVIYVVPQSKMD